MRLSNLAATDAADVTRWTALELLDSKKNGNIKKAFLFIYKCLGSLLFIRNFSMLLFLAKDVLNISNRLSSSSYVCQCTSNISKG
jgi:hypothetical protein